MKTKVKADGATLAPPRHSRVGERQSSGGAEVRYRWRMGDPARKIVLTTAVLLAFGLAVLYSASAYEAVGKPGLGSSTGAYYLLKQLSGVAVGAIVFVFAAKIDAARLEKLAWPLMIFAIVTMTAVLFLGARVNGSTRFLVGNSFQPSEFAKLAVIVWVSMLIVRKGDTLRRLSKGLLPFLVVIGVLDVLAALEPDLSVAMLYTLLMAMLLYVGGARMAHFVFLGALAIPVVLKKAGGFAYAEARIASFFDPSSASETVSYQLNQSLIAVGSGGWTGRGFGQGMQQLGFLPFPYSDFIASNIGEEWGFLGLIGVTLLFAAYGLQGFRIARQARSQFLQLVAIGLTFTTVLTAYLHIGVVIGLLPTTGLTLPFISYGRSNLVLTLLFTGILVNIGSTREKVIGGSATDPTAATP
ncbi:MAG TPA: putative peptidoglycan glycosyltransferase FtsW [Gemmatimonadaceae bacterium]|nr:putative peptidoglycan glycosyltransferase FtsW [Gemmatimonadaceae bacterium]